MAGKCPTQLGSFWDRCDRHTKLIPLVVDDLRDIARCYLALELGLGLLGWQAEGEAQHEPSEASKPQQDPHVGRDVGAYRIERLIAQGGMGAVYLATRTLDFEQRVALKLVHPQRQTVNVIRRFAAERQILARLEHPHIARLLDGGTTDLQNLHRGAIRPSEFGDPS